jgi:PAS domain S-box-containing protein
LSSKTTRFESLLHAVPDALVGMDQEGVITFVNRQAESLFGFDRDQLIGQPFTTLVPEVFWRIFADLRDDYLADSGTQFSGLGMELSGAHRNGGEFPINLSISRIDTGDLLLVITAMRDVNKRQMAIRDAQLIEAIVEYSDDAIISMTLDGIITSWNPAAEQMYGYLSKDVIGTSGRFLLPEDRAEGMPVVLAWVKQGQVIEDSLYSALRRKDGTMVPLSLTVSPIRDADGAVVGVVSVHRDITVQKQVLEAAQRMASIVNDSDDAIIGSTLEGIITSWNPAAERLFGYSSEQIIGTSVAAMSSMDRPEEISGILAKVRSGEHIHHLETNLVRRNGKVFPVSLTVSPICDEDGAVVGMSMISRNMTALRHAAQYARSLIEADPDPLVTISPEGTINDVNEAAISIIGVSRDELIGTDFSRYFTDPDKAQESYQQAFAQGLVTDYPLTVRHRDGTLTHVLYNTSVYCDFNGEVLGVLAAARDMTKPKEAFEAAQRKPPRPE